MVLGGQAQLRRPVGYAQPGEYYASDISCHEAGYSKPGYGKQNRYEAEDGYHNSNGSSMQMMKPYPNISSSQLPSHHVVGHDGYVQQYGKPHGYDKHSTGDGYYGNSHGYDNKHSNGGDGYYGNSHGYDKHSNGAAANYDGNSHGYDKHSNGKYNDEVMYGKTESYGAHEVQGYPKYPNEANRFESVTYNYHAEGRNHQSHQNWASEGANWILRGIDD